MKPSLLFFSIVLSTCGFYEATAQDGFIRVTGSGVVKVKPDVATITAYVIGKGDSVEEATSDYKSKSEKALEVFDPMEYRDVKVTIGKPSFSMGGANRMVAMMGVIPGGDEEPAAYMATCAVTVNIPLNPEATQEKINSIVNKVVVGMEKAKLEWSGTGMPQSTVVKLSLKDRKPFLDEAMKQAVEEARRKAAVLAGLSGRQLGGIISVEETTALPNPEDDSSSSPYSQLIAIYSMMMPGNSDGSDGMIEVTSHLEVTFAFKPR